MKKLLITLALLLVPVLLYYCVFIVYEPNNYFGLRAVTPSGAVFGAIREYQENPVDSVILGDSRLAHIDMELVKEVTGRDFGNLAFGGASLKECLDLLDWLLDRYPTIDEIVFELSFYTANANYAADRFKFIEKALYNPFAYMTNLSYNLEALQRMVIDWQGGVLDGGEHETQDPETYVFVEYKDPATGQSAWLRDSIIEYMETIAEYTENWRLNETQCERLLATIEACTQRGIRFVVVMPPVHESIVKYEMQPYGIDRQMKELIGQLKQTPAQVWDYELTGRPPLREDQFFDGFHLDYERGLDSWTEMFFSQLTGEEAVYAA